MFKYVIPLSLLVLLSTPRLWAGWGSCSGGSCLAATVSDGWEWRPCEDKDQLALFKNGVQIGNYRLDLGKFYEMNGDKWLECPCPCELPDSAKKKLEPNFGLIKDKIHPDNTYSLNGKKISRKEALAIVGADVPNDAHLLRLTVIGSKAQRDLVLNDLKTNPLLAEYKDKLVIQDYDPGHWALTPGFVQTGSPTIYLQQPDGKVLHRQDDYEDGAQGLVTAIRKADPNYNPQFDRDLRKPDPSPFSPDGQVPWVLVGLGGLATLLFLRKTN